MSIEKKFMKAKPVCKAVFTVPLDFQENIKTICLVGDFNGWNKTGTPMKKNPEKGYTVSLELDINKEYQFRYLINGTIWANDSGADGQVPSPFPEEQNSVIVTFTK